MTVCDSEGVPELIQCLRFNYGNFLFVADLFDGRRMKFDAGIVPSLGLMHEPTRLQMLEAQNRIEKFVLKNFAKL